MMRPLYPAPRPQMRVFKSGETYDGMEGTRPMWQDTPCPHCGRVWRIEVKGIERCRGCGAALGELPAKPWWQQ